MATLSSDLILRLRDGVTGPARRVGRTMRNLDQRIDRTARGGGVMAMGLGRSALALTAVGGAAIGAGVGIGSSLGAAMDMEDALVSLQKVSTLSETQLAAMRERAVELSSTMPVAASEIVNLMASASQFGIAAEDLEDFSLLATKASVAFDMDPSQTAQSLSELRNGFKLTVDELGDLADALNTTADNAGTSEEVLINFLGRTASLANDLGLTGEEMAVIGATLSELGISAERSSTATNKLLTVFSDLTGNDDAVTILDRLGGKGYSERLQKKFFETPVDAIAELAEITKDMSKESKTGFFIELFGREHADEASALLGSFDRVEEGMGRLSGGKFLGSVDKTFELFAETTRQKLKVLRNNFSNVAAAIGTEMLPGIVSFSEKLSDTLSNLDERVTVFDTIRTAADGFFAGLVGDGEELQSTFDDAWKAVFGDPETLEEDTAALAGLFDEFKELGSDAQQAASDIMAIADAVGTLVSNIEGLFNLGEGSLADFFKWDHSDSPGYLNKLLRGEEVETFDDPDIDIARMDPKRRSALASSGHSIAEALRGRDNAQQAYWEALRDTRDNVDYWGPPASPPPEIKPKVDTTEIEEARTVADTFSTRFGTLGTMVVSPLVNPAPIDSANAAVDHLLSKISNLDRGVSPRPQPRGGSLPASSYAPDPHPPAHKYLSSTRSQRPGFDTAEIEEASRIATAFSAKLGTLGTTVVTPQVDSASITNGSAITGAFSDTFGTLAGTVVTPVVDPSSINSASAAVEPLLSKISGLDRGISLRPRSQDEGLPASSRAPDPHPPVREARIEAEGLAEAVSQAVAGARTVEDLMSRIDGIAARAMGGGTGNTERLAQARTVMEDAQATLAEIDATSVEPSIETASVVRADAVAGAFSTRFGAMDQLVVTPLVSLASINAAKASATSLLATLRAVNSTSAPSVRAPRGSAIDGARASGGPVWPGTFLVGEEGPELATFGARGFVHNAADTRSIMDGINGGAQTGARPARETVRSVSVRFGDIIIEGGTSAGPEEVSEAIGRRVELALRSHYSDAI